MPELSRKHCSRTCTLPVVRAEHHPRFQTKPCSFVCSNEVFMYVSEHMQRSRGLIWNQKERSEKRNIKKKERLRFDVSARVATNGAYSKQRREVTQRTSKATTCYNVQLLRATYSLLDRVERWIFDCRIYFLRFHKKK